MTSCDYCGKTFQSEEALNQHLSATGHRHVCHDCNKFFRCNQSLLQHCVAKGHSKELIIEDMKATIAMQRRQIEAQEATIVMQGRQIMEKDATITLTESLAISIEIIIHDMGEANNDIFMFDRRTINSFEVLASKSRSIVLNFISSSISYVKSDPQAFHGSAHDEFSIINRIQNEFNALELRMRVEAAINCRTTSNRKGNLIYKLILPFFQA